VSLVSVLTLFQQAGFSTSRVAMPLALPFGRRDNYLVIIISYQYTDNVIIVWRSLPVHSFTHS
jgi:hypothetical protein